MKEPSSATEQTLSERNNRKRLSPQAYKIAFGLIYKAQQGSCQLCQDPMQEIDHINGDPGDRRPDNLRGLCKSCNIRQRNLSAGPSADSVNERVNLAEQQDSAEIEINRDAEPRYRKWLFERTGRKEPLYSQEAIYGGAEIVGISPITARRYLGKVTSPQGSYWVAVVKAANRTLKQVVPK